jgi:hypothetical protein
VRLVLIGLVAGLFSTLFGVGGGIVTRHGGTHGSPMSPLLPGVRESLRALPGRARHGDGCEPASGSSC